MSIHKKRVFLLSVVALFVVVGVAQAAWQVVTYVDGNLQRGVGIQTGSTTPRTYNYGYHNLGDGNGGGWSLWADYATGADWDSGTLWSASTSYSLDSSRGSKAGCGRQNNGPLYRYQQCKTNDNFG